MKKNYTFLLILILVCSIALYSQVPGVTGYTVNIPGTTITNNNVASRSAFVIDNTGNKWIGFNSGNINSFQLLRYNGSQWDTFSVFKNISPTNKVNALAVDANNNLWIGSNMGLTKFNGAVFTTYNTSNSGLVNDTITALTSGNGNVYVGNKGGLAVFNGTTFTNYNSANNGMHSNFINCITYESPTSIWLGDNAGLEKFNGSTFLFNYITPNNTADVVNCVYIDTQNNKWIGTNTNGVIKYDNSNFTPLTVLFPEKNMQEVTGFGLWPTEVKEICTGLHGGVLFSSSTQPSPLIIEGRGYEIVGSQVYTFAPIDAESNTAYQTNFVQYDAASNKLWLVMKSGIPSQAIMYSYSFIPYSNSGIDINPDNSAYLDINNVSALIGSNASQYFDDATGVGRYFVPKNANTNADRATGFWIGGYNNNTLYTAATTYRANGLDFWPGPLNPATDSIDAGTMGFYDKQWKINRFDIANFIYHWNNGDIQSSSWTPPAEFINWPGNSPYTGQMLAPYFDNNNDGHYNYLDGDYPLIKGDQMIWSVINDKYGKHLSSNGNALGIEIQTSAYAYTCPNIVDSNIVLNNTTFYNYKIYNRSSNKYDSVCMSIWMATGLGNPFDDQIRCDVMHDFGYVYNGDNYDDDISYLTGYHTNLPMFACNILRGPLAEANDGIDNNHNCQIDEPGENCMMSGFSAFFNTGSAQNGNPNYSSSFYNLSASRWGDGSSMTYGNQGLTVGGQTCTYLFPGNSDPFGYGLGGNCNNPVTPMGSYGANGWTREQGGGIPTDYSLLVNIGKFTMQPNSISELDYAMVFSQDSTHCDSINTCVITRGTQDNIRVKNWFNNNAFPSCLNLSTVGIEKNKLPELNLNLYPNPANINVYIEFNQTQKNVTIEVYDMLGNIVNGYTYNQLDKYVTIPVNTLQNGMYMIKIQSIDGTAYKKFIKG